MVSMSNPSESPKTKTSLGPISKVLIVLSALIGTAIGMYFGRSGGEPFISPPIVLGAAIIIIAIALVVIRKQRKAKRNSSHE